MNCPKCNNQNAEGSAFCSKCGTALTSDNQVVESQQTNTNTQTEVRTFTGFGETISTEERLADSTPDNQEQASANQDVAPTPAFAKIEEPLQPANQEVAPTHAFAKADEVKPAEQIHKKPVITAEQLLSKEQPIIVNKNPYAQINAHKELSNNNDQINQFTGTENNKEMIQNPEPLPTNIEDNDSIDKKVKTYIGKKYDKFERNKINIWAFIFGPLYDMYRKTYKSLFIELISISAIILYFCFSNSILKSSQYFYIYLIVSAAITLIYRIYNMFAFNKKYLNIVRKRCHNLPNDEKILNKKGKTSLLTPLLLDIILTGISYGTITYLIEYLNGRI